MGCLAQTDGPVRAIAPPSSCPHLAKGDEVDTDDIVRRLNNGELSPGDNSTDAESAVRGKKAIVAPVPIFRCENGPKRVSC